ncbi:hypothetical protein ONO23_06068 [Micromonospora noduli]|nr:hypothetical protein ONO23_06068 [Micromonospora noduli]
MSKPRRGRDQRIRDNKVQLLRRRVSKADSLGRKVSPTVEAYERVSKKSSKKLAQTLIARHTLRMDAIRLTGEHQQVAILSALAPVTILDKALLHSGASTRRPPAAYVGGWADHLAWGVDSAVSAVRLLLCGQVVGAAALVRNQLERWTFHRATNAGLEQQPGESTAEYVARVWTAEDHFHPEWFSTEGLSDPLAEPEGEVREPSIDHKHVVISNGSEICPALLYELLSEVMHGRALLEAVSWDSNGMLQSEEWPDGMSVAVGVIVDAITLCLRELRAAVASLAERTGRDAAVEALRRSLDTFSEASRESESHEEAPNVQPAAPQVATPPLLTLMPLLPNEGLNPEVRQSVARLGAVYSAVMSGQRPAGRLFRDDELTTYTFAWHRARSIRAANAALDTEKRILGDQFNIDSLTGRATRWVLLTESVSLLGRWHQRPEASAAATLIGTALRSAYWLWLEDDDRAMSVLRCVLEQASRLRTWRIKPAKAAVLESRVETTPRDWLEAAGWKRLAALNRALGELAHTKSTSRWTGARELLAKFQMDVEDDKAIYTARGASIDFVAQLVAQELCAEMEEISPTISEKLCEVFLHVDLEPRQQAQTVEEQLDHIWNHRGVDLGISDFVKLPELWPQSTATSSALQPS